MYKNTNSEYHANEAFKTLIPEIFDVEARVESNYLRNLFVGKIQLYINWRSLKEMPIDAN